MNSQSVTIGISFQLVGREPASDRLRLWSVQARVAGRHQLAMRHLVLSMMVAVASAGPQIAFGGGRTTTGAPTTKAPSDVNTRLGLLAGSLGLDPVAGSGNSGSGSGVSQAFTDGQSQPSGRTPQQCCCVPVQEQCGNLFGGDDLVGTGLIDPRLKNRTSSISTRIVNRPIATTNAQQTSCPTGQKTCCYDPSIDLSVFGVTCISPEAAIKNVPWTQGCAENVRGSFKQCGTRQPTFTGGLGHGTSAPGEFPWTCLLLNQNNDFVGSCAIIPDNFNNDNSRPTRKVITAAHKLKSLKQNE